MAATSRAAFLCACLVLAAVVVVSEARDFVVGGANGGGWKVPARLDAFNKWAEATRFQVGDNLVFKFDGAADSVLEVSKDGYASCNTTSPIATYKQGGAATVPLPRSGAHYFVSGAPGSCGKGERLLVVVMSEKHGRRFVAPAPAPAAQSPDVAVAPAAGSPEVAPAVAPATGAASSSRSAGNGALLLAALLGAAAVVGF